MLVGITLNEKQMRFIAVCVCIPIVLFNMINVVHMLQIMNIDLTDMRKPATSQRLRFQRMYRPTR